MIKTQDENNNSNKNKDEIITMKQGLKNKLNY